jgi:hypothetical protein
MARFERPLAANGLDDFTNGLALLLGLDDEKAVKLSDLIADEIKRIGDERYADRPDLWRD